MAKKHAQHAGKMPLILPASEKPRQPLPLPSLDQLGLDIAQVKKAVDALVANAETRAREKQDSSLFETEEKLELVVTLKRVPRREKTMPIRLKVPHSLIDPRSSPVCLLVKDPQRHYKNLLESKQIGFISKVVGVTKLKGKYKPFEARRQLMRDHDMFLADDNIIPLLPKLLGRNWIDAKRQPIPVALSRTDLKAELERAISASYLYIGRGTCLSIKAGVMGSHSAAEMLDNVLAIVPQLASRLPQGGWGNVQGLALKTSTSVSLPIWLSSLEPDESLLTSRFYKPEWTVEPPHPSKRAGRLDLREAARELLDSDDESHPTKRKASADEDEERASKRQKVSSAKTAKRALKIQK